MSGIAGRHGHRSLNGMKDRQHPQKRPACQILVRIPGTEVRVKRLVETERRILVGQQV